MKPKTKLQHEVLDLHKTCLTPAENHKEYLISKFPFFYTTHYRSFICLECNHMWKPQMEKWKEEILGVECPHCNKKLKYIETQSRGQVSRYITGTIVETVGRFQVFRYVSLWKYMEKGIKPTYSLSGLFEEWVDYEKDKSTIIGRCPGPYRDGFTYTDYEIRYVNRKYWRANDYHSYTADYICPNAEYLPRFKYYGLDNKTLSCDPRSLLRKLKDSPTFETILKLGNQNLIDNAIESTNYITYFNQIKIAFRHKYSVKDFSIWFDYLGLLKHFEKDLRNPILILPKNLKKAHDEYVIKKQKSDAIKRARKKELELQEERLKAEADEALRGIKEKAFNGLKFKAGKLEIVPLIKEKDVEEEGKILRHCVHASGYHNKSGIILMSARIGEQRIETIEISLASYKILQSRGVGNSTTEYHDEIIHIVRKNMSKISKIVEKHKQLKLQSA